MSDIATDRNVSLPRDMAAVVELMKSIGRYSGSNTEFVEKVSAAAGKEPRTALCMNEPGLA